MAVHVAAALRRLVAVLDRRCRCECYRRVRNVIANPFWSLVGAAVAGVAGGEPWTASVLLSDERTVALSFRTKILFINANHC